MLVCSVRINSAKQNKIQEYRYISHVLFDVDIIGTSLSLLMQAGTQPSFIFRASNFPYLVDPLKGDFENKN